jgi:hypothetical protein
MDFWKFILNESGSIEEDLFFDRIRNTARGILVDSEPKVIKSIQNDKVLNPLFPPSQTVYTENGRGNNWALGYSKKYRELNDE